MSLFPDFETFKKMARKGNLVALVQSVPADLETPVSSFLKTTKGLSEAFLLESAEQEEKIGRYSFIGLKPSAVLVSAGNKVQSFPSSFLSAEQKRKHLVDAMESSLKKSRLANPEALPGFAGGFVGYLAYENVSYFEQIKLKPQKGLQVPDAIFYLTTEFIIFDHFRKTLSFVVLADAASRSNLKSIYRQAERKIKTYIQKLKKPLVFQKAKPVSKSPAVTSNMTPGIFEQKVKRIKEYIRAGDCIQVVLSQRFKLPLVADDFQIYRALRSINPSPYMFYFKYKKMRLIGSSPELLVKKEGQIAEVRPIAGTRPRGKTASEDLQFEENLKKSVKETAEHLMLVDLGRNDLGRVCEFDSIKVKNFARVERYSHVMHLVSDVTGKLKRGKNAFDLLKATFPAGTVSGAPKIRAMQIINELEPEKRGPYAGSLGYFSFNHDMDMCITIRTLVIDGKNIYLQAGAGIVKDSIPQNEYQETVNKAKALLKAISMRGNFDAARY